MRFAMQFRLILTLLIAISLSGCGGGSDGGIGSDNTVKIQMGGSIQRTPNPLNNIVTTLAGSSGSRDGIGVAASFSNPYGMTTDGTSLYVTDSDNNTIRKIAVSTGNVTTLAGIAGPSGSADGIGPTARFNAPRGIVTDGVNLYVVDANNTIRKIVISTGAVTTLAGTAWNFGPADGIGPSAQFFNPNGITTDGANLYVTDFYTVRKIVISTGAVTTIAGTAYTFGSADGTGNTASFNGLQGITTDGVNLYVTDSGNNTIRKIVISTGVVTTIAGFADAADSIDGTGSAARFSSPQGIFCDGANLYVIEFFNGNLRKIVIATGVVTTLAGSSANSGASDGTGATVNFRYSQGITINGPNLFVAGNNTIRKFVVSTGVVTTFAGSALSSRGSTDGVGGSARFFYPQGMTTDGNSLFLTEQGSDAIRKITIATGAVSTIAGGHWGSADGIGPAASFLRPNGITTDGINLYVADSGNHMIRKIVISTGVVTTIAGNVSTQGSADGIGSAALFYNPNGITTDGTNLYVTDFSTDTIRKIIISTGAVSTIAGTAGVTGSADGTGAAASFNAPQGITTDGVNLYVTEYGNGTIRKIAISTGIVTTFLSSVSQRGSVDGIGAAASFTNLNGITTDGTNLYLTDACTIREVGISSGVVTTIAGSATLWGAADGVGLAASFNSPDGITSDGSNLYVADWGNNTIRQIH